MKKTAYISIIVAVILIIALVVILCLLATTDRPIKNVTLEENGVTNAELNFNARGLHPSESREYTIVLHAKVGGRYGLSLQFDNLTGALAQYVEVELVCDDYSQRMPLTQAADTVQSFECDITDKYSITVRFILPEQVGNEAQGAFADFELLLTAQRS